MSPISLDSDWDRDDYALAVREAIKRHRDEVAERCLAVANARDADAWSCSDAIDDAFDCLLALVEGKPWPESAPVPLGEE